MKLDNNIINTIVDRVVTKLSENKLKMSAFQKTELLLTKYRFLEMIIEKRKKLIETIKKNGIATYSGQRERVSGGSIEYKSNLEKVEDKIHELEVSIEKIQDKLDLVDSALDYVKDDKHYKIIEMKYFEKKTNNLIAEALGVDEKTVRRNKNRLIETISIWIFPDEVLNII